MRGRLLYRDAQGRDSAADLVPEGSFVGRAQECVVRTDDAMVSRRNCRVFVEGSSWQVEDLGSSNGTFVNEKRVQRQALRHADIIRCGTLQVRFVEIDDLPSDSVNVDPALLGEPGELDGAKRELEAVLADRSEKEQRLFDLGRELDALRLRAETDGGEMQRLRAELVAQRDKLSELSRVRQLTDEELSAQTRVAEQLRRELEGIKKEHLELRDRLDKTSGDLQARDRQLERANEDIQRSKLALDETRGRFVELERTKDEGWRELNNRVGELDGLRAVISEQERLLEERRVGLISLEASAQDLRQDKERLLRELTAARSEREEAKNQLVSLRSQLEAFEEEHRRLQRSLSEASGGSADEALKLGTDLRQSRVAYKTIEAERDRLLERADRADAARAEAEQKLAKLDVERTHAVEERQRAVSAKARAEEALARAELQRQAADEARRGIESTDAKLMAEIDRLRVELDAARVGASPAPRGQHRTMPVALEGLGSAGQFADEHTLEGGESRKLASDGDLAELRMQELEEELSSLGAELAIARAELESARGSNGAGTKLRDIQRRAEDAYHGVNDVLSELRTNILLARQLVGELGADSEAARSLAAAIATSVERTEDAKGILRVLKEVVDA